MSMSSFKKTILLVEDQALIAMKEASIIQKHGYKVITAYNAEKAIAAVHENSVDLILMDIDLGDGKMDGTAAAERILEDYDLPIVFLTSHCEKEMVDRVKGITRYGYVLKNSGEFVLMESINMAFTLHETYRNLIEKDKALLAAKEKSEEYLSIAGVMILAINNEGIVTLANKKTCEVLGCGKNEIEGKRWLNNFIPPGDRKEMGSFYAKVNSGEIDQVEYHENKVLTKSGEERIVSWHNAVIYDDGGNVTGHLSSGEDITDRKREERRRRESEEKYKALFEREAEAIFIYDPDTTEILDANTTTSRMYGYEKDELIGMSCLKLSGEIEESAAVIDTIREYGQADIPLRYHRKKDGTVFPVNISGYAITLSGSQVMFAVCRDITETLQTKIKLKESESFLDSIVDNIPAHIFVKEARNLRYVRHNKASKELHGYTAEEVIGKSDYDLFPRDEADFFTGKDREVLETGHLLEIPEEPIHTKEGEKRLLRTKKIPIYDEEGRPKYLLGISEDITKQKKDEEDLMLSELKYRMLFENNTFLLYLSDIDGKILMVNRRGAELFGYSRDAIVGKSFFQLRPDRAGVYRSVADKIISKNEVVQFETVYPAPEKNICLSVTVSPVKIKDEILLQIVAEDISGRKTAEQKLMKTLKDKDWLIKEMNHRIKNNLLMIETLIELRKGKAGEKAELTEIKNQIQAIRLLQKRWACR